MTVWEGGFVKCNDIKGLYRKARNLCRMGLVKFHTIFWLVDVYYIREPYS